MLAYLMQYIFASEAYRRTNGDYIMFNTLKVKPMHIKEHDRGYGGYRYKVIVCIELDVAEYNKLPKITIKSFFGKKTRRHLDNLVITVNNLVYNLNKHIPVYNPSIDSQGDKRSKNGVKSMQFEYFFNDHDKAEALGMVRIGDQCFMPKGYYMLDIKPKM